MIEQWNKMKLILLIILTIVCTSLAAQKIDTVEVSNLQTSYILLESDVTMVDVGSKEFGYSARENMVILKAVKDFALPTTLMVRTKTSYHVWMLKYARNPRKVLHDVNLKVQPDNSAISQHNQETALTASVQKSESKAEPIQNSTTKPVPPIQTGYTSSEQYIKTAAERYKDVQPPAFIEDRKQTGNRDNDIKDEVMQKKFYYALDFRRNIRDVGEISNGIYFMLYNVFVDREYIYIKIGIHNTSSIAFDLDFMTFERAQGKTLKKREASSYKLLDLHHKESVFTVAPATEELVVFAVKLFAFQDNDSILVKLTEMGGVRSMKFSIPAKLITTAKSL